MDGLVEELLEGFQRVLIHVVHNGKGNDQEIEHGTFSCDMSVSFSLLIDHLFGDFSFSLLVIDINSSSFG